ncbi:MAG: hypothetical protein EXX96DRAFT_533940 [Benjaminiella poitrasii]|nr:MAG: hypothetical protein EXX96DRAFT_533940 [Benjaminiella poitrasii]
MSKTKQRGIYIPGTSSNNKAPIWRAAGRKRSYEEPEFSGSTKKKNLDEQNRRDQQLFNAPAVQYRYILTNNIRDVINGKGDLSERKDKILDSSSVPRGLVKNAEHQINAGQGEIAKLLARERKEMTSVERWKKYVQNNFDVLAADVRRSIKGKEKEKTVEVSQEKQGPQVDQILPEGYNLGTGIENFPPPLEPTITDNHKLVEKLDHIFNDAQLQIIHSKCFGPAGTKESTMNKHPFLKALTETLDIIEKRNIADPWLMKVILNRFMVNFRNLWTKKNRFYKMLDKVLLVLLRAHLRRNNELRRREAINRLQQNAHRQRTDRQQAANNDMSIPVEQISVINQSYSTKKRLFKNKRKLRQKYLRKAEQANDDDSRAKFQTKTNRCPVLI